MSVTYDYPRPALTTDIVLIRGDGKLLLIRRKHAPFEGMWALPGGFLDEGEDLDACAVRELQEETEVAGVALSHFANFSTPGRDPRSWTVSAAYVGRVDGAVEAKAADDAAEVGWFSPDTLPALAFDHDQIIAKALTRLKS